MSLKVKGEEYLVEHYTNLGDLKTDFRNVNLYNLAAQLVKGQTVLDIGCGVGEFLSILKTRGKTVSGVEPSSGMRELARKINPGVPIRAELNLNEKVDVVVMLDVLEHIEDDQDQVIKIHSVLNPTGNFVFVVPAHPLLYGQRDKEMGHFRRYSKEKLVAILTANGFRIKYLRHWNALGFLPYLVSEKILRRSLDSKLRESTRLGVLSRMMRKALDLWFRWIENNFDFGFGLSIIGVARKVSVHEQS